MSRKLTIAIDFDGCITKSIGRFPTCGRLRPEAKKYIISWFNSGHTIIINTCRTEDAEDECIEYLKDNEIPYTYINQNSKERIDYWKVDCRKISADIYFDDRYGVVDWKKYNSMVMKYSKPTIICIVGESGSGKTTVAEYIKLNHGIPMIESRTTRPPRTNWELGHTFITEAEFGTYSQDDMIAFTTFGSAKYCCLRSDVKNRNTYVIDEYGLQYLRIHFKDKYNIFSIRIIREESIRIDSVGWDRVSRDAGKFHMSKWDFDARIYNNADEEYLFDTVDEIINKNMLYI